MNEADIVVDTNIFFSLLLREDAALRKRFLTDNATRFHCPRFVFVELFKHKERIAQATELSGEGRHRIAQRGYGAPMELGYLLGFGATDIALLWS